MDSALPHVGRLTTPVGVRGEQNTPTMPLLSAQPCAFQPCRRLKRALVTPNRAVFTHERGDARVVRLRLSVVVCVSRVVR
jgi:hypothetical protein